MADHICFASCVFKIRQFMFFFIITTHLYKHTVDFLDHGQLFQKVGFETLHGGDKI